MGDNILKREQHLHQMNIELEMKTKELWKEMEDVLKNPHFQKFQERSERGVDSRQDFASFKFSEKCSSLEALSRKSKTNAPKQSAMWLSSMQTSSLGSTGDLMKTNTATADESHPTPKSVMYNSCRSYTTPEYSRDDVIPEEGRGMGEQATIRFLKAKAKVLQEEYTALQTNYKKQGAELSRAQAAQQQAEEERAQAQAQARRAREQQERVEQAAGAAQRHHVAREAELSALRKEVEKLKKELKSTIHSQKNNEVRLNRSLEEVEKYKTALKNAKLEEKERMNYNKKKNEEFIATIQKLEKQKVELINAFKKQLQLIENLRRQKTHLEASHLIQFTEDEFLQLLDWNPEKKEKKSQNNTDENL